MSSERDEAQELTPLKRALFALRDLRARLDAVERARVGPIAIVGMACRFPGAPDLESYWRLLDQGVDAIREVPRDRWDVDAYFDPDPDAPGKTYSREGGFLDQVDGFDASFFGIPPREVVSMDPQQRLLLEVSWEALENAGMAPGSLGGLAGGVFVGIGTNDYTQLTLQNDDPNRIDAYMGTGGASCVAAGRISYILGLHGPAMALDTACSSSLVAIDVAVQQLRAGRCQFAIAGGVNVILSPTATVYLSKVRALSPTSRCRAFDASADGYVRGEGCGIVVLKRLSDAQRDGDTILAVVRGSAANHDGRSSGLTVPNGQAQQAVVRQALSDAGLTASDVQYIEAHGTGTPLGDPIELRALGAVLGENRPPGSRVLIGTVKTNIGHLEAAAGVAGLIKVVLSMRHGVVPPSLHFREPNPRIPWDDVPITVASTRQPWPHPDRLAVAGVSAYGFSGTNAHIIVEAAPPVATEEPVAEGDRPAHVLTLSAPSPAALAALAAQYSELCAREAAPAAADLAFSANTGRSPFDHRVAVVGANADQYRKGLQAFLEGREHSQLLSGIVGATRPKIAFLFTGQGSQYAGMGRELYETQPSFRRTLDRCDEWLRPYLERPLLSVMHPDRDADASLIHETAYTQPALFALEYALAELWRSWGVEPAFVMGHSVGEYVAACVAGALTLEDGLRLIAERGRLMQALPSGGRMAAVFASEAAVAEALRPSAGKASIAAVNGPEHTVVSGYGDAIADVLSRLAATGIRSKDLVVSHAFHSQAMDPILDAFEQVASTVTWENPRLRIVSNLTGAIATRAELSDPRYWRRHIREAVRFSQSVATLHAQGVEWFVEIGPNPTLLGMAGRCVPEGSGVWLPSLRKGGGDWQQILKSVAAVYVRGASIDWRAMDSERSRRRVSLPNYPFQRDKYWIEMSATRNVAPASRTDDPDVVGHPRLGTRVRSPLTRDHVFETRLTTVSHPFVADHVVFGAPVFPATGYVDLALAGAAVALGEHAIAIEDMSIEEPLVVSDDEPRVVQLAIAPAEEGRSSFQVFSRAVGSDGDAVWTRHANGRLAASAAADEQPAPTLEEIRQRCARAVDAAELYGRFDARGIEYGPRFRGIAEIWQGQDEAIARLVLPEALRAETDGRSAHPAFLDAALQVLGVALSMDAAAVAHDDLYLPVAIGRLRIAGRVPERVWSHARLHRAEGAETITADLRWFDDEGRTLFTADGVVVKRASSEALRRAADRKLLEWVYEIDWQPAETSGQTAARGTWLVLGEAASIAPEVIGRLSAAGAHCVLVSAGADYRFEPGRATLDPSRREHFARLLTDVEASGRIAGVIHLWGADCSEPTNAAELDRAQADMCGSALALVQALGDAASAQPPRLTFVTRGAQAVGLAPWPTRAEQASLWGVARVVALEQPQLRCTAVDLDPGDPSEIAGQLVKEVLSGSDETQVAFRAGQRYAARLVRRSRAHGTDRRLPLPSGEAFQLTTTARGVLDNLVIESRPRVRPGPGDVEIRVHAAGLNFRDVLNALGMYPGDPGAMGGECAGRVVTVGDGVTGLRVGDDVLCLAGGSFSKYVVTPAAAAVPLPEGLSYEQGASIPVTFLTAYYGLHHLARIKKGDRVLIHAAAGGVGQAAVQIALRAGAQVYGTAGAPEKRNFVKAMGAQGVFSSRTADFVDELRSLTGGHGVDIVLNSLTGAFIPNSLAVIAPGGHFLEIGKAEIWTPEAVAAVNPGATYRPFDLAEVMHRDLPLIASMFADVMGGLADGSLRPLPIRVFDFQDAMSAFRFMAQAKHVGKIVLSQHDLVRADASGEGDFDAAGTYLVTGGYGGLGLKVAEWLVSRGARHLVLTGRSAPSSDAARAIEALEGAGAAIAVARADVSREDDVRRVLAAIGGSGAPLRGVIHAAGVLDDGALSEQTWPRFEKVMAPKVRGAWLLHELTRNRRLDCFVLFSSTSAVLGAPGQANYAAANAYMDGLAHYRRACGLPALSINWGAWGDVGMAARLDARERGRMAERGLATIPPDQGTRVLGHLLRQPVANVVVVPIRWRALLQSYPQGGEPPLLKIMAREAGPRQATGAVESVTLAERLKDTPASERRDVVIIFVRTQLAKVLGLQSGDALDIHTPFSSLGLDSLMAVEVRNALASALRRPISASLVFDHPTIDGLATRLLGEAGGDTAADVRRAAPDAQAGEVGALLSSLDQLSDEKVASLLAAMMTEKGAGE